jgi:hypothetical protein
MESEGRWWLRKGFGDETAEADFDEQTFWILKSDTCGVDIDPHWSSSGGWSRSMRQRWELNGLYDFHGANVSRTSNSNRVFGPL